MNSVFSLLRLPPEILLRIFELSPSSSLKELRASCAHLKAVADPLLWHTIHLYPHMDRLRQILALSMHPPVRHHCRQLVYDLRYAPILDHIIRRIQNVYTTRASVDEKTAALERARTAKRGKLEPGRDDDIELLFLQDILRNLTSLESIIVLESNVNPNTEPDMFDINSLPSYYQKIREVTCGSLKDTDLDPGTYCLDGATRSTKRILVAAHSLGDRINNLEIRNAHWEHVVAFEQDGKHLDLLRTFIGGLKSLTLRAWFNSDLRPAFLMHNLSTVLSLASNLKFLDLSFGAFSDSFSDPDWSSDDEDGLLSTKDSVLEMMGTDFNNAGYGWAIGLEHLVLSDLSCRQSELISLFKTCASTLKNLEIGHLLLVAEKGTNTESCLVSTLKDIRSTLKLDTIWLYGDLRNSRRQAWNLKTETIFQPPSNASPLLLERVMEWMLGPEPCPIEDLAVKNGCLEIQPGQFVDFERLTDPSFDIQSNWVLGEDRSSVATDTLDPEGGVPGISLPINHPPWDEGVPSTTALYSDIDWDYHLLSP